MVAARLLMLLASQPNSDWSAYVLGGLVSRIGTGLINGQMTNAAMSVVPTERAGMASGINGLCLRLDFAGVQAECEPSEARACTFELVGNRE